MALPILQLRTTTERRARHAAGPRLCGRPRFLEPEDAAML